MSYTPDEQLLTPPCEKVLEGLDELVQAMNARHNDPTEWKDEHLEELIDLEEEIVRFRNKIRKLKRENR